MLNHVLVYVAMGVQPSASAAVPGLNESTRASTHHFLKVANTPCRCMRSPGTPLTVVCLCHVLQGMGRPYQGGLGRPC